jgi:hypothetical protein
MSVTDEPIGAVRHERMGKSGKDAQNRGRGEKWPSPGELVTHPRNSLSNVSGAEFFPTEYIGLSLVSLLPLEVPASVFFGTSGVPGDGCAASELGAARVRCAECGFEGDIPFDVRCGRSIDDCGPHYRIMGPNVVVMLPRADWRSFCATGEELG